MLMGAPGGLVCGGSTGTLGILVRRNGEGCFVLSCSHVVARAGRFTSSFRSLAESQRVVQQQDPVSCDPASNRVGLLQPGCSRIATDDSPGPEGRTDNTEDCGLVLIDAAAAANVSPVQSLTGNRIRFIAAEDPASWRAGMLTRLLGAKRHTSEDATGEIIGFQRVTSLAYPGLGDVTFRGGVLYRTRCAQGDSGGAVIDEQNRLLGMHLGGNPDAGIGLFMPLRDYFAAQKLTLF